MDHVDSPRWEKTELDKIEPLACPCGTTRRGFAASGRAPASIHLVEIAQTARRHYHREHTEFYIVLEGTGYLELDGEQIAVQPCSAIKILPGCRHRAIGAMKILNVVIPPFDPDDEHFDETD